MQLSTQLANTDSKPETACNVAFARLKPGMLQILEKGNYIMIIDLILDRREDDKLISAGYTHVKNGYTGELIPIAYNPHNFYRSVMEYGEIGSAISAAMDYGTEENVRSAICGYILDNGYNPDICNYVRSVNWLTA